MTGSNASAAPVTIILVGTVYEGSCTISTIGAIDARMQYNWTARANSWMATLRISGERVASCAAKIFQGESLPISSSNAAASPEISSEGSVTAFSNPVPGNFFSMRCNSALRTTRSRSGKSFVFSISRIVSGWMSRNPTAFRRTVDRSSIES